MLSLTTESDYVQPLAPPSVKTRGNAATKMIQELNNKACDLIGMGDYAKANQLLGMALENHKRAVEGRQRYGDGEFFFDDDDISCSSSSAMYDDDYEYDDDDMDTSRNDTFDFYYDCPRDQEQGSTNCASSDPTSHSAAPELVTTKMRTCSDIYTMPCAGQNQERKYHKVYSKPIVMDDSEWQNASPDDRSFVLVFNSAISNHLWGMQLLSTTGTNCNQGPFETAKALYVLALETLWNTGNAVGGGRIRSVDKLCVPAIFNNLSHTSKVLEGYNSKNASIYDSVLVKSVFWWIDGNSSVYASSSSSNGPNLRRASEGDDEVVDAFLDTVFYLISEPECTAPAAAA